MATPNRTLTRMPMDPRLVETLSRNPQLMASTVRLTSTFLPGLRILDQSKLPVFYEKNRPDKNTNTLKPDVGGKQWATLLYWLGKAHFRPRFTHDGLTIDFEPTTTEEVIPLKGVAKARMKGLADGVDRYFKVWWRTEAARAKLTINYDFGNDNERELVRSAIQQQGLRIELTWTHDARYQPQQDMVLTEPTATINPALLRTMTMAARPRMVVERPEVVMRIPNATIDHDRPPRRPPPRTTTPPPKPPESYSFDQSWLNALARSNPMDPIWQDGPSPWKAFSLPSGRKMYYRATGRSAEFEFLPTEFRLGFDATKGLPALVPYVYNPKDAEGKVRESERRVELRMMASPHVEVEDREALRVGIQKRESVDLAVLVPPVVQGRFEISLDLQGAENRSPQESVELAGVFWLEFDFGVESWLPNLVQLDSPGGGVVGRVVLDILPQTEGADVSVPVVLRLTDLHADVVEVEQKAPDPDGIPRRFVLRNRLQRPVTMSPPTIYVADQAGEASPPTNVRPGRPKDSFSTTLAPGEVREVVVTPTQGSAEWNALYIDLAQITVDPPEEGWDDEISFSSEGQAAYPVKVRAMNLRDDVVTVPQYDSTQVTMQPLLGGTVEPPDGRLEKGAREWTTRMWLGLAQLAALEKDPTNTKLYALEFRSDYTDCEGLPQRVIKGDSTPGVRVLTTERRDSKYELLDEDERLLESDLDRATTQARIDARRAAGQTWKLRVIEPEGTGTTGDGTGTTGDGTSTTETGTSTSTETTEPPAQGPKIIVNPVALDFMAVPKVFVTLKVGEGDQTLSHTLVFEASSAENKSWSPVREAGTPVRYTIVYLLADGTTRTVSGTESSDLVMVLPPES